MIRCAGVELHVEEAGEGRPVLMLHGFPDSHALWRDQIPALADAGHRVIAPDLPGYGESETPAELDAYRLRNVVKGLVELLDQLRVESTAVVGHDWGAATAWGLAALEPDRVDHLAALSVGHPAVPRAPSGRLRDFWYMLLFQYPEAEEILTRDDWKLFRALDAGGGGCRPRRRGAVAAGTPDRRAELVPREPQHLRASSTGGACRTSRAPAWASGARATSPAASSR